MWDQRWVGIDQEFLQLRHTLIYSRREDNEHEQGIGLFISKKVKSHYFNNLFDQGFKAVFNTKFAKLAVLTYYAPTEETKLKRTTKS